MYNVQFKKFIDQDHWTSKKLYKMTHIYA